MSGVLVRRHQGNSLVLLCPAQGYPTPTFRSAPELLVYHSNWFVWILGGSLIRTGEWVASAFLLRAERWHCRASICPPCVADVPSPGLPGACLQVRPAQLTTRHPPKILVFRIVQDLRSLANTRPFLKSLLAESKLFSGSPQGFCDLFVILDDQFAVH